MTVALFHLKVPYVVNATAFTMLVHPLSYKLKSFVSTIAIIGGEKDGRSMCVLGK
jgi:hypothetical protein